MNTSYKSIPINDASEPGEARRNASRMAHELGMNETRSSDLNIVVTEAANNLLKHAGGGEILLCAWENDHNRGIDVFALDKGRGIADLSACLQDGYSSAGTSGTGLGAIARLATKLEIHSTKDKGTALFARLSEKPSQNGAGATIESATPFFGIVVPLASELVSGDAFSVVHAPFRTRVLVADGLGHGVSAAEASQEAVRIFQGSTESSPAETMSAIHDALKKTRGAAVAIAEIKPAEELVRYCGVGNISASILSGETSRSLMSHNGTVGHNAHRITELNYPFPAHAALVMHSDGLSSHWSMGNYPGLLAKDPALIAATLYRDFKRGRDDSSIFVFRQEVV